ncbi:MAG: sugar phosphate isomerase/epimerase [Clostridiaceae bacterium]|nr:sugar phosphate isomerase/epimerase [Clostridiaceae bacterium]
MKKGINIWSFDPKLGLEDCFRLARDAGFAGIELALAAAGPVSLTTTDADLLAIRRLAGQYQLEIPSLATGLYWQFSLTSNRPDIREQARAIVRRQLHVGALLGAGCILVVPGTVGVDFRPEDVVPDAAPGDFFAGSEIIDYEEAYQRSLEALRELAPAAERTGVTIGIENIWNKFLLSPLEMRAFIDAVGSERVGVFFDVGNAVANGYPEQWIRILGQRICILHLKDYRRAAGNLSGFVDLLAGDVDWPAVMRALAGSGYTGWANAEMCPTYRYAPSQMVRHAATAMDQILTMGTD